MEKIDLRPNLRIISACNIEPFLVRKVVKQSETYPPPNDNEDFCPEPSDVSVDEFEIEEEEGEDFIKETVRKLRNEGCTYPIDPLLYQCPDTEKNMHTGEETTCKCTLNGYSWNETLRIFAEMQKLR